LRLGGTGLDTSDSDESGEKEEILLAILGFFPGFSLIADRGGRRRTGEKGLRARVTLPTSDGQARKIVSMGKYS
jgi:hypothetical protein